jgi:molecular chaperone GrpE (heat shock protein)
MSSSGGRSSSSDRAFEALYEELKQYKEDFVFQAEKPLLLDLLLFYDSLNWLRASAQKGEIAHGDLSDSMQFLIDEFLEILYRRDVLPMESQPTFDPSRQSGVKVVPTLDPAEDRQVSEVLKRGFTRAGRVLRSEEVVLKRFGAPSA